MPSTASEYLLLDCNAFFVSCERVFNPALRKIPTVVLSSNDGCVIARSLEAKQIGIPMCAPYFQVKQLLKSHGGIALSSNFALYAEMSRRVMTIIHTYCQAVEVYSIDEAFIFMKTPDPTLPSFLIETILKWTGLPVTIGAAPTKTLAKLASDIAKKEGKSYLKLSSNIDELLKKTPVETIWGIGKKLGLQLERLKINTAYDLKMTPGYRLKKALCVTVEKIALELSGTAALSLEMPEAKQSLTYSRSFEKTTQELNVLSSALSEYTQRVCKKLRNENQEAQTLTVFLATSPFDKNPSFETASFKLTLASQDTALFIHHGRKILEKLFNSERHYKKIGITLLDLSPIHHQKLHLFEAQDPKKEKALKALDLINQKFGNATLSYASSHLNHEFQSTPENRSRAYLSDWDQLLEI